ncbi:DUF262 domain-containing protein [Collinsella sp. An2]|uniref:DUF262 domain-containing protein n=1 Tax=Collinsella sp. An2 TaxID=1965585 RepID=UPI000B39D1F7|nr:DUF262 domain-containing protein [Collinsella sp. An2]OUP06021.1 hypothetical protein B5F33_10560 [Collinsella sp. An2]
MPKAFEAEQKSLEELMSTGGRYAYAIPLYQRRYVWNTEENRKLWDDVEECYERKSNHFLGSFVLMDYEKDPYDQRYQADELVDASYSVRHVVDGQQRMTSLTLILAALYQDMLDQQDTFNSLPDKDSQDVQDWNTLLTRMRNCLVTDVSDRQSKSKKGKIPHLIPVKSTYESYKSIVNQEQFGKQLLIEKAYLLHQENVRQFRLEKLPEMDDSLEKNSPLLAIDLYDFYFQMFLSIAQRMKIIRIDCSAEEDAFQVFESLNGTGVRLTSSDRIKNMLMGRGSRQKHPVAMSTIESEWTQVSELVGGAKNMESFFTSYMFTKVNRRVSKQELVRVFTDKYLNSFESKGVLEVFGDLKHAADYYGTIVSQSSYMDGQQKELSPDIKALLVGIRKINPTQSIVPLLTAAMQYKFDSKQFRDVAKQLLVLFVRHKVCQKSTNLLDKYFEKICVAIKEQPVSDVLDEIVKRQQSDPTFARDFENMTFDSEKPSDTARARYYLESIENYLRNKAGDSNLDQTEEFTLEHIIPQSFDAQKWFESQPDEALAFQGEDAERELGMFKDNTIESIGNMCLLRRPENSSASNSCFANKVASYKKPDKSGKTAAGTFKLVEQIVEGRMKVGAEYIDLVDTGSTFDATAVSRRAHALADYALKIWS